MLSSLLSTFRTQDILRATYRTIAPVYDVLVPTVSSGARAEGRTWLCVQDGEDVLDVGIGTGLALAQLAAGNPSGWTEGIDCSPAMLRRARRRMASCSHARYGLRRANAAALPYPDNSFHAVFSSYLIDVLPTPQIRSALREMRRVLRPQGRLVLVYLTAPQQPREQLWAWFARALPPFAGGGRPVALRAPLRECGFEVTAQTTRTQAGLRSAITRATPSQNANE